MMQRLFPENLAQALQRGGAPFYLLSGQDLLLVNEAKDQLVGFARQQGFEEKIEVNIANDTPWESLFEQTQANGLFSSRTLMILNLPETLTSAQQKQLAELVKLAHSDLMLIFHLPKLSKATEKQTWLTQIEANTVLINCQTPDIAKLPTWIAHQAHSLGLQLDHDVVQLLCYSYEGNLLALKQILQLLRLYFTDGQINLVRAKEVVEQSAQFTPFQWIDALLEGKTARAQRILRHLHSEDTQAVILLRLLQKELSVLLELSRHDGIMHSAQPLAAGDLRTAFDRLKIWQNRRPAYQAALKRLTYRQLLQLIQQLATLERKVKQEFSDDIWQELARFWCI